MTMHELSHKTTLTMADLRRLIRSPEALSMSLFMPTVAFGPQAQQDGVRLRNLVRQGEALLERRGLDQAAINMLLAPLHHRLHDPQLWYQQGLGLALFITPGQFSMYSLPFSVEEQVVVGQHAYVVPLLPLLSGSGSFFVLDLGLQHVSLYHCTRDSIREEAIYPLPPTCAEYLASLDTAKVAQFHAGTSGLSGKEGLVFYGHGAADDTLKDTITHYFKILDQAVLEHLGTQHYPLILAGVEYLQDIYRQVSGYRSIQPGGILGSSAERALDELHQHAWSLVRPLFEQPQQDAFAHYMQMAAADFTRISENLRMVLLAAAIGQVELLFVQPGYQQWGHFDTKTHVIEMHDTPWPHDEDLVNVAIIHTLLHAGMVYPLPATLSKQTHVAALLRY